MSYTTKNYAAHGGEEWVIGGKLTILEGAVVEGLNTGSGFTPAANIPASTATTVAALRDDFNAYLAGQKASGQMNPDPTDEGDDEGDEGDEGNEGNEGGEENPGT